MKKVVSLVVALLLVAALTVAGVAETAPSITVDDLYDTKVVAGDMDSKIKLVPVSPDDRVYQAAVKYANENGAVAGFFGDEIAPKLTDKMGISEACTVTGFEDTKGNVKVSVGFPEEFKDGQKVAVVLGTYNGEEEPAWMILDAEIVDKKLEINFTDEAIEALNAAEHNIVFVLSEPAE